MIMFNGNMNMFNGMNNPNHMGNMNNMNTMNNMNAMNNNNPMNFLQQFNEFRRNFQGNPQQTVLNLLNSGQMSQQTYNQLQTIANQIMNSMGNH